MRYSLLPFGKRDWTSNIDVILLVTSPTAFPKLLMFDSIRSSSVGTHFGAFRCTHTTAGSGVVLFTNKGKEVLITQSPDFLPSVSRNLFRGLDYIITYVSVTKTKSLALPVFGFHKYSTLLIYSDGYFSHPILSLVVPHSKTNNCIIHFSMFHFL